jgi:hypothetical protein
VHKSVGPLCDVHNSISIATYVTNVIIVIGTNLIMNAIACVFITRADMRSSDFAVLKSNASSESHAVAVNAKLINGIAPHVHQSN